MAATNFKHHTFANIAMLALVSSIAYLKVVPVHFATTFIFTYLFATLYSPDVDMADKRSYFKNFSMKNPLISLWKFSYIFWWPYGLMMGHRGISHIPVAGTLTRVIYLAIIAGAIALLLAVPMNVSSMLITNKWIIIWGFFGWCSADIAHIFLDHVGSALSMKNVLILSAFVLVLLFIIFQMNFSSSFISDFIKA